MCKDFELFDPLPVLLDLLDGSLIPTRLNMEALGQWKTALDSLTDLGTLFFTLSGETSKPYVNHAYKLLLERWKDVVDWMTVFIMHTPRIEDHEMGPGMTCVTTVRSVLGQFCDNDLKDEIFSQRRTLDLMLLMLCQVSRVRQCYWNLQSRPEGQCLLADLLFRYCISGVGDDALCLRLGEARESTRFPVVKALVSRVRELVDDAEGDAICGVASTTACFTHAIKRLARHPRATESSKFRKGERSLRAFCGPTPFL